MSDLAQSIATADYDTAPFFAVLDGAQFDDLPAALREGKFVARSLYLDRGENNPDQVVTAPHLVWLDETPVNPGLRPPALTVPPLMELVGDRPAAVFWRCPAGGEVLFRHLRGINMIAVPAAKGDGVDPVLFRHADANALCQVAAVLDAGQVARLLGPAASLVCVPDEVWRDGTDMLTLERPDPPVAAPTGLLTLTGPQMARMEEVRVAGAMRRTKGFLRRHLPEEMADVPDADLDMIVARSRKSGRALGIRSTGGHHRWAYLMALTQGRAADDAEMRAFLADPHGTPDEQVKLAMRGVVAAARKAADEART